MTKLPASPKLLFNLTTKFVKSSTTLQNLPNHDMPEIAFAGRSNVGKSSLINSIMHTANKKDMAIVSKVGTAFMLVDLPGYGFAKVKEAAKDQWDQLNEDYLLTRPPLLRATYVLIDSRRGLLPIDFNFMCMLHKGQSKFKIVLTKTDRIKQMELETTLDACRKQYKQLCGKVGFEDVVATSAKEGDGLDYLKKSIYQVLKDSKVQADA